MVVLLIDPDESITDTFSTLLGRLGFDVLSASNERDSMYHLCESAPDAVVVEPDVAGSWARSLLARSNSKTPWIVVSRFRKRDTDVEFNRWLTKPVSISELVDVLSRVKSAGS